MRTSGGVSDTEQKALTVMPWSVPLPSVHVTIVTPEAKRPSIARNASGSRLIGRSVIEVGRWCGQESGSDCAEDANKCAGECGCDVDRVVPKPGEATNMACGVIAIVYEAFGWCLAVVTPAALLKCGAQV
jgi:hypothetical protein